MGMIRRLMTTAILGSAAYGYYQTRDGTSANVNPRQLDNSRFASLDRFGYSSDSTTAAPAPQLKLREIDLAQVFWLDIQPAWVMANWQRVSTVLSEMDLQGYRVSLVTGTQQHDLAGALTYYFDRSEKLRRITFVGTTGNFHLIAQLMQQRFRFRPQKDANPRVTLFARKPRKPLLSMPGSDAREIGGRLRIRPAAVVRGDDPNGRYEIDLLIES